MSYAELDDHPRKHSLMSTAFTLSAAFNGAKAIWKARAENKSNVQ